MPRLNWMHSFLFIWIVGIPVVRSAPSKFQRLLSTGDEECNIDCSVVPQALLCGNDGRTYRSLCELEKANCEGHPVSIKHMGKCQDSPRCLVERRHALEVARRPSAGIFIPECKEDGTYQESQCHTGTGYCWCTDLQGKPIPGSAVRSGRPNCLAYQSPNSLKRTSRGRKARNSCSINERKDFNRNIRQLFGAEFSRSPTAEDTATANMQWNQKIANWKFSQLDTNKNQKLEKGELRDLRKMVRKIVHPKSCARTFTQYCDLDQDKVITRPEWEVCLDALHTETSRRPLMSLLGQSANPFRPVGPMDRPSIQFAGEEVSEDSTTMSSAVTRRRIPLNWRPETQHLSFGGINLLQEVQPVNKTRKRDPSKRRGPSCRAERSKALMKFNKDPSSGAYVPDCEDSGRYTPVQCHPATRFCWCVNPDDGKPIPHTSTQDSQPNCKQAVGRTLKGCPGTQKLEFMANLTGLFTTQMKDEMKATISNRSTSTIDFQPSVEDAVRWKFRSLDTNQNGFIERLEWKPLREAILKSDSLSRCGARFFKFCDSNDDRRVGVDEMLSCTVIRSDPNRVIPKLRRGPNPLDRYLKSD